MGARDCYVQGGAKAGLQLWVRETQFILVFLFINYCVIFRTTAVNLLLPHPVHYMHITLVHPHNNPKRWVLALVSFDQKRNKGREEMSNMPKITQPVSGWVRIKARMTYKLNYLIKYGLGEISLNRWKLEHL